MLDWHQCSEGKTFMIWYILGTGVFVTVGIIIVYYGTRQIHTRRLRRQGLRYNDRRLISSSSSASTGGGGGHNNQGILLDADRQHIVYQSVPSHYPVPVGVEAPEPMVQGTLDLEDYGSGGMSGDEDHQAMALMGNIHTGK